MPYGAEPQFPSGRVPSLSIIVPVLDEAPILVGALQALATSRQRGAEVIVVDGGSWDGTPELARPHADRVIAAERGRGVQMNAGARMARADVLRLSAIVQRLAFDLPPVLLAHAQPLADPLVSLRAALIQAVATDQHLSVALRQ